jgi:hypothetical protein
VQVTSRGPVPVKGLTAPIEIREPAGASPLRSQPHAAASRGLTRFVGRDAEIELLRGRWGNSLRDFHVQNAEIIYKHRPPQPMVGCTNSQGIVTTATKSRRSSSLTPGRWRRSTCRRSSSGITEPSA